MDLPPPGSLKHPVFSILILLLCLPVPVFAGWEEPWPVAVNSYANPGDVNDHANSGGRRIVRIEDVTLVLCPHASGDRLYRSLDGDSWEMIDSDGGYSGALITGPENTVFHFWKEGDGIFMVRFSYDDDTPPDPVMIYTDPHLSETGHGAYSMLNATVDEDGVLFVATHWDDQSSGGGDSLYLIRSMDGGDTWTPDRNALVIRQGDSRHSWGFILLHVTPENELVCVYRQFGSGVIQFARSSDQGETWETRSIPDGNMANPSILATGDGVLYVFAQSSQPLPLRGLVFNKSTDGGVGWEGWNAIDSASLSGYADPAPGLGSDGTLYVAYRSGARPDLSDVFGGAGCRERLARSTDGGLNWDFPDDYFYDRQGRPTERTGTRSQIRYQTWWNYGGPLEWIWMQYEDGGGDHPIYYDVNPEVEILDRMAIAPDVIPLPAPEAYGNIRDGDRSHADEVNFSFAGVPGDVRVLYETWDVDWRGEVEIHVNGVFVDYGQKTEEESWGKRVEILLDDADVMDESENILTFSNPGNPENQHWWGVGNVAHVSCTDLDGDGFGDPASFACEFAALDCNDSDASVNPGMPELQGNGIDDDCDPSTPDAVPWEPPPPSAQALASYGEVAAAAWKGYNSLALFLIPMGSLLLLRYLHRNRS